MTAATFKLERAICEAQRNAAESVIGDELDRLGLVPRAATPAPGKLTKGEADCIWRLALDLETTGRLTALTEGAEKAGFMRQNRETQCALEDALAQLTAPAVEPVLSGLDFAKIRLYIERASEEVGYGYARPANPNDFSPDAECCTAEEIAAHKAVCEAYDKGEYTPEACASIPGMHILSAPWGIGSYTVRDEEGAELLAAIDAELGKAAP